MIYQLSLNVEETLRGRGWPVRVVYGRERMKREAIPSMLVVIERDDDQGDSVGGPIGVNRNPRSSSVRYLGVRADVYVRDGRAGAMLHEHQHVCDDLVDALVVALFEWQEAAKVPAFTYAESRYLKPEEINGDKGGEHTTGVVYRLRFAVPRGVTAKTYEGAAEETVALDAVTTTTRVTLNGDDYETVPRGGVPPAP